MALFLKKHWSKVAKFAGISLFALLMFVNLQITNNPKKNGDINLYGLKISLTSPSTYAEVTNSGDYCADVLNCTGYDMYCGAAYVDENGQILPVTCFYGNFQ